MSWIDTLKLPCLNCKRGQGCYSRGLCRICFRKPGMVEKFQGRKISRQTGDRFCGIILSEEPTEALPGTEEKILVMQGRFERWENLFHPLDGVR
jgi:hypothetical protein